MTLSTNILETEQNGYSSRQADLSPSKVDLQNLQNSLDNFKETRSLHTVQICHGQIAKKKNNNNH